MGRPILGSIFCLSRLRWALVLAATALAVVVYIGTLYFSSMTEDPPAPQQYELYSELHSTSWPEPQPAVERHTRAKAKEYPKGFRYPQWTWICRIGRCVRLPASDSLIFQSLQTCNMLCRQPVSQLWPQPTGTVSMATSAVPVLAQNFTLNVTSSPSQDVTDHLNDAFTLMRNELRSLENAARGKSKNYIDKPFPMLIHVDVNGNPDVRLRLDTDESYRLYLKPLGLTLTVNITANSFCGARHGFETLSQLIWFDPYANSLLALEAANVEDAPRFRYRGLLVDTSRNYFPVADLMRTIDAMAACKMNSFHWHATDSNSFPLVLQSVPQFAKYGAYGSDAMYKTDDVRAIVRRARLRGIRVLIEVDAPAHVGRAWSWGPSAGLGDLAYCVEEEPWRGMCGQPPCGQLNPRNPYVYELLEITYKEIIELTGVDDIFHIGGDEVFGRCWSQNLKNAAPMTLWYNFTERAILALGAANGGTLPELTIVWSSQLTRHRFFGKLNKKRVGIQVWSSSKDIETSIVLKEGYRTIISHVDKWYLDCGFGSWRDDSGGHCEQYKTWQQIYEHRPWTGRDSRVEGGEVCQWSELVGTGGLDQRVWPRAAALAERLWSDKQDVTSDISLRLDMQRSRLVARGVRASPLNSRWCSDNPYACN